MSSAKLNDFFITLEKKDKPIILAIIPYVPLARWNYLRLPRNDVVEIETMAISPLAFGSD